MLYSGFLTYYKNYTSDYKYRKPLISNTLAVVTPIIRASH